MIINEMGQLFNVFTKYEGVEDDVRKQVDKNKEELLTYDTPYMGIFAYTEELADILLEVLEKEFNKLFPDREIYRRKALVEKSFEPIYIVTVGVSE